MSIHIIRMIQTPPNIQNLLRNGIHPSCIIIGTHTHVIIFSYEIIKLSFLIVVTTIMHSYVTLADDLWISLWFYKHVVVGMVLNGQGYECDLHMLITPFTHPPAYFGELLALTDKVQFIHYISWYNITVDCLLQYQPRPHVFNITTLKGLGTGLPACYVLQVYIY